jgi:hypothetical protein
MAEAGRPPAVRYFTIRPRSVASVLGFFATLHRVSNRPVVSHMPLLAPGKQGLLHRWPAGDVEPRQRREGRHVVTDEVGDERSVRLGWD